MQTYSIRRQKNLPYAAEACLNINGHFEKRLQK